MKLTLDLDPETANKLRRICYRRDLRASDVVTEWITKASEDGTIGAQEQKVAPFMAELAKAIRERKGAT